MSNKTRAVPYYVKRIITDAGTRYIVHVNGRAPTMIKRDGKYFFANGNYHRTLRDAIIYVVYGV